MPGGRDTIWRPPAIPKLPHARRTGVVPKAPDRRPKVTARQARVGMGAFQRMGFLSWRHRLNEEGDGRGTHEVDADSRDGAVRLVQEDRQSDRACGADLLIPVG